MFIPTTLEELKDLHWDSLDIIIVTGDTYIDSSYFGATVIGKLLLNNGYRVGIIAQPDITQDNDIRRLGEPRLFWGVTSGAVDSMISNYTAGRKKRQTDDLTPGGKNNKRPDRAVIAYTNLIRRCFKNTVPIVLGGIEASLRRIAHYDWWDNTVRRSVIFDAKADYLIYGMAEKTILEFANVIRNKQDPCNIRGLCYKSKIRPDEYIELPDFESCASDRQIFAKMYNVFYTHQDPYRAKGLIQQYKDKYLIHNPPAYPLTGNELDRIYTLDYERKVHPYYLNLGPVRALETIQFSITSHRGCNGECNFCSITLHQGRIVISRSQESIIQEAESIISHPDFKGIINDIGGPTVNMYGITCNKMTQQGTCIHKSCLWPKICPELQLDHNKQITLLHQLRQLSGIKKIFIGSGLRYDLILADEKYGEQYLHEIILHHVSGHLKIAPEHTTDHILTLMRKPNNNLLLKFIQLFNKLKQKLNPKQFLTYYFIAAHPGCTENDMISCRKFINSYLHITPEQVQIFTPSPSTYSTLMYYTETNTFSGKKIFVEKQPTGRDRQKQIICKKRIQS